MSPQGPENQPALSADGWIYDSLPKEPLRHRAARVGKLFLSTAVLAAAGSSYQTTGDFTYYADALVASIETGTNVCDNPETESVDQQIRQFEPTDAYADPNTDLFDDLEDYGNFIVGQFQENSGLTFYNNMPTIEAIYEAETLDEVISIANDFTQQFGVEVLTQDETREVAGDSPDMFALRHTEGVPGGFELISDPEANFDDIRLSAMQLVQGLAMVSHEIIDNSRLKRIALVADIHRGREEYSGVWIPTPNNNLMLLSVNKPFFADHMVYHELYHGLDIEDCDGTNLANDPPFEAAGSEGYYWIGQAVYPTDYAEIGGTSEYKAEIFADIFTGNLYTDPSDPLYQSPRAVRQRLILARMEKVAPGITSHALALQAWYN